MKNQKHTFFIVKLILSLSLIASSSSFAMTKACSTVSQSAKFDVNGIVHDKTFQISFFETGFNLQIFSKSKNSLVLLLDGRKAYSLQSSPYRIYSQKSALSADYFDCQESTEVCGKINKEIKDELQNALSKVESTNTQAANVIKCALSLTEITKLKL